MTQYFKVARVTPILLVRINLRPIFLQIPERQSPQECFYCLMWPYPEKPALNFYVAALLCSPILFSFDVPTGERKIGLGGVF